MSIAYSGSQKNAILVWGDLLEGPLSLEEATAVEDALNHTDSLASAVDKLPAELGMKLGGLLGQGIRLAQELTKLSQRGVSIVFSEDLPLPRVESFFASQPRLLFVAGAKELLGEDEPQVFTSLSEFEASEDPSILIADRPFEELLREEAVINGLCTGTLVLVSDRYRAPARIVPSDKGTGNPLRSNAADSAIDTLSINSDDVARKVVFISGSRSQIVIPKVAQDSLNAIMELGLHIIIGDSNKGVDNEIIDYLRRPLYERVTVYTIRSRPRVKVEPEWQVRLVEADTKLKPQERQMVKDRTMAATADWGFALFNPLELTRFGNLRVSAGTLRNTVQMLLEGKQVKLFYTYGGSIRTSNLRTLRELETLIESYVSEDVTDEEQRMILSSRGVSPSSDAAIVKASLINKKYNSLLKTERRIMGVASSTDDSSGPMQIPLF